MIKPRKIAGWEFFDQDAEKSADVDPVTSIEKLGYGEVEDLFARALGGRERVIDIGCGGGWPGLNITPYIGELIGIDAAPNMVDEARRNLRRYGVTNARFEVGGTAGLPFADGDFDGAMLCGVLESMDWEGVHRMMPEVRRVLAPGARVAVLDQDWKHVMSNKPDRDAQARFEKSQLRLFTVERRLSPDTEVCTWYAVGSDTPSAQMLRDALGHEMRETTTLGLDDLRPEDVLDAWYDETAQFDEQSLSALMSSHGFTNVDARLLPIWGQIVFVTARMPGEVRAVAEELRMRRRSRSYQELS